jgi:fructose-1,6-bisphosphatase/inositol monophosphatase family enzyme
MIRGRDRLLMQLKVLHAQIRASVVARAEAQSVEQLAEVVSEEIGTGDTIFAIDKVSEDEVVTYFTEVIAPERPLILIAEGLPDRGDGPGRLVLPRGIAPEEAELHILLDPIDGTRGYMYQKRSAWILTGVAPNHAPQPTLSSIEIALQTEIPLVRQHLCDQLWAFRGEGYKAERFDRLTNTRVPVQLHPSRATSIAQGFATIARFFPGNRAELAAIDDEVAEMTLGRVQRGQAQYFEDQYICTGGQLYELIAGHDRFIADLRPLLEPRLQTRHLALGICCHPYDLATVLIAEEAGVLITDGLGHPLDAPLDVSSDVSWSGFANAAIRQQVEPALLRALASRGLG